NPRRACRVVVANCLTRSHNPRKPTGQGRFRRSAASEPKRVNSKEGVPAEPPSGISLTLQRRWLGQIANVDVVWEPGKPSYALAERLAWSLVGLFAVAYLTVFAWLSPLALQDFPN